MLCISGNGTFLDFIIVGDTVLTALNSREGVGLLTEAVTVRHTLGQLNELSFASSPFRYTHAQTHTACLPGHTCKLSSRVCLSTAVTMECPWL
eukprot:scaffold83801_cov17-Tisochrysis_lutea.AAC.1